MKGTFGVAPRILAGTLALVLLVCRQPTPQLGLVECGTGASREHRDPSGHRLRRGRNLAAEDDRYCEKTYHIACYEPFQIQRAYNEGPLFDKA